MPELAPLLANLGLTLAAALIVVGVAFVIGVRLGKHRVVDVFWGLGFAAVALAGLGLSAGYGDPARRFLVTALTVVWGVRLAVYIGLRGRGQPEDPRYDQLLARAAGNRDLYALRTVYLVQGVSLWFISWPVQVAQYDPSGLGVLDWLGVLVWGVGIFFEAVGDAQLTRFKADPANRGTVLDSGLWRYTRHPNYFGDACVWWGLWLIGCGSVVGVVTIVCPVLMTYLLARRTGKPMLERHLSSTRPGYAAYVARTSGFVPRPPRRT